MKLHQAMGAIDVDMIMQSNYIGMYFTISQITPDFSRYRIIKPLWIAHFYAALNVTVLTKQKQTPLGWILAPVTAIFPVSSPVFLRMAYLVRAALLSMPRLFSRSPYCVLRFSYFSKVVAIQLPLCALG